MSQRTVLITGGSGFIGMVLAEALLGQGRNVVLFGTTPSPLAEMLDHPNLTFVAGDVRSRASLEPLASFPIETVVHGAAITPDTVTTQAEARQVEEVNVDGARTVMAFAAENDIERVVQLSSVSVYGSAATDPRGRFDEAISIPAPDTLYGRTKLAAEWAMEEIAARRGTVLTRLRLGPVFGPWEVPGPSRTVTSPHHQCLVDADADRMSVLPRALPADWMFSTDLARTVAALLDRSDLPNLLNVGAGRVTSLVEWCTALSRLSASYRWRLDAAEPSVRVRHAADRPVLSTSRLDALLPDRPVTTLDDAAALSRAFVERARAYTLARSLPA